MEQKQELHDYIVFSLLYTNQRIEHNTLHLISVYLSLVSVIPNTAQKKKKKKRRRKQKMKQLQNYIIVTVSFQIKWDVHNDFCNHNLFNDHVDSR